jgi:hypothetical protein
LLRCGISRRWRRTFLAAIVRSLWIGRGDRACDRKERRQAGKQDLVRARLDQIIDHLAALGGVLIARRVCADYALRIDMTKPKPKDQLQKRGRKSDFRPEYI